jgi:hypothetical protein
MYIGFIDICNQKSKSSIRNHNDLSKILPPKTSRRYELKINYVNLYNRTLKKLNYANQEFI